MNRLEKYAKLAVIKGVNIQKGQMLVINCPVAAYNFGQMCAKEAYEAGASYVEMRYNDEITSKYAYQFCDVDVLKNVPNWQVDRQQNAIDHKCAFLHIISEKPGLLKDIDSSKIQAIQMEHYKVMDKFRYYTTNNVGQWSIVAIPNETWADLIFPNDDNAVDKLWEAIYKSVRIDNETDPIELWKNHNATIHKRVLAMNDYHFDALHFKNDLGTDLHVNLNQQHIWRGGEDLTLGGVPFNPNMPTEEIFTMPSRCGVNGIVYGTKPLNYQGKLIEDFYIEFKDGKAINWDAKKEKDALSNLINTDEGSAYLGEVALISNDSPISNMNILFMNTLFDENASCHLALGAAYPTNMVDGEKMTKAELIENDANVSMTHVDFMFGSACMQVIAKRKDADDVVVFKNGNFVD